MDCFYFFYCFVHVWWWWRGVRVSAWGVENSGPRWYAVVPRVSLHPFLHLDRRWDLGIWGSRCYVCHCKVVGRVESHTRRGRSASRPGREIWRTRHSQFQDEWVVHSPISRLIQSPVVILRGLCYKKKLNKVPLIICIYIYIYQSYI
jgi:hypothetical protein